MARRLLAVEGRALDDDEPAGVELVHRPFQAIGRDPDKMLALLALAVGEVIGHAPLDIRPFTIEIALGLEDRPANQGVEPAAHLGHAALEVDGAKLDGELLDQQRTEIGLDLVMAGTAREMAQQLDRPVPLRHASPRRQREHCRGGCHPTNLHPAMDRR